MAQPSREVCWVATSSEFKWVGAATDQESGKVATRILTCPADLVHLLVDRLAEGRETVIVPGFDIRAGIQQPLNGGTVEVVNRMLQEECEGYSGRQEYVNSFLPIDLSRVHEGRSDIPGKDVV